jgi:hypothetical protein
MVISSNAENWLKENLDISIDHEISPQKSIIIPDDQSYLKASAKKNKSLRPSSARHSSARSAWGESDVPRQREKSNDGSRPMSAYSKGAASSKGFREMNFGFIMMQSREIYDKRNFISETVRKQKGGSLRDLISPSDLLIILRKCGVDTQINIVKGVLMELGYEQSGSVCNLLEFFKSLRAFLNINAENDDDIKSFYMLSTAST